MILRSYGFWIVTSRREECLEYLENNTLKEMTTVPGNLRATALFRDLEDGATEVTILSLWDSPRSVAAYLGSRASRTPKIDPSILPKLYDREPYVRQYALSDPHALELMPAEWR